MIYYYGLAKLRLGVCLSEAMEPAVIGIQVSLIFILGLMKFRDNHRHRQTSFALHSVLIISTYLLYMMLAVYKPPTNKIKTT